MIAETIDVQPEQERETLQVLVEALVDRLKQSAPAIGLDIGRLTEMDTHLGKITVGEGIGARIGEARGGRLDVDEIIVGSPPRK